MPFLSATERIIREAEAAEAQKFAPDERPAQASPEAAGGLPEPLFADGYPVYEDLSDGITRVDLNRSALALEKLRALDAQGPAQGAPHGGAVTGPLPPPAGGQRPGPDLPGRPRRGPPPGRPTQAAGASLPEPAAPRTPSAPLPAVAAPLAEPSPVVAHRSRSISLRHSPRVGRRLGLFIVAGTAAAVAPLIGSWTARFENAASARGGAETPSLGAATRPSPPAGPAPGTIAGTVVPVAAPAAASGDPAPAQQAVLPAEASRTIAGSPVDSPESAASRGGAARAHVQGPLEPRPAHKSSGGRSRRRAAPTKLSAATAPRAGAPRAAGPSPGPARHDPRASGDPDDTLPIAIE